MDLEAIVDKICTDIDRRIDPDLIPEVADAIEILEIVHEEIEMRIESMKRRVGSDH